MPILYLGPDNVVKVTQDRSDKLKENTNENSNDMPSKTKVPQKNGDSNNNSALKDILNADKSKGTYIHFETISYY